VARAAEREDRHTAFTSRRRSRSFWHAVRSVPARVSNSKNARAGNGRPQAKERAEAFVRAQLANGPRHGKSVKRNAAEAAKISERTLIAATDALDVRTQRGQWWLPR
jgi:hypothetical protein